MRSKSTVEVHIQVHPVRLGRVAKREATHVIKVDGRGALWRILCDEGE